MALNTSKCNHLPPLPFKGLMYRNIAAAVSDRTLLRLQ